MYRSYDVPVIAFIYISLFKFLTRKILTDIKYFCIII